MLDTKELLRITWQNHNTVKSILDNYSGGNLRRKHTTECSE